MNIEITVTGANFKKEVLESPLPVLLDFWAEWCNPCRMIAPSIEQLAETYKGKIVVGKVNVDAESDLALQFDINSIPTLMVFKDGQVAAQKVGAFPKHDIETMIKDAL
ncbi:MAG: thioredoxin [Rectinemataceae bacterium]|jgi:thioredoxin 1